MRTFKFSFRRCSSGQALLETALALPLILAVVFNAINFGYYFLVALNLSVAPRSGILYSISGSATPGGPVLPAVKPSVAPSSNTTTVSYLTYWDITGALGSATGASLQICSAALGVDSATHKSNCITCTGYATSCSAAAAGSGALAPSADPEPTLFSLNRVDITYSFRPLIPGTPFGIALMPSTVCSSGTCTFHRQVSMRAMD